MKRLIPIITVFLLVSLACSLPNLVIDLSPEPTNTSQPPSQPAAPVSTLPVVQPAPAPSLPVVQPAPAGTMAIAVLHEERALLSIISPEGQVLGEISAAGLENAEPGRFHIAGKWSVERPPLVFYTFANGGQILVHTDGQINLLMNVPMFASLTGVPGEPILAYSTAEFGQTALTSRLFVSQMNRLPAAGAVVSIDDPKSRAIKPLAIHTEGSEPDGVWYTLQHWGIGGDIVFEPTDGLYYANLKNGTIIDHSNNISMNVSLSPDQVWAANARGTPGDGTFHIYNLLTGENLGFNPLPANDRGSGYGVFSPSSQHVAWMEGSGWQMAEVPNFHATIRIGTTGGVWLADYPDTTLASLLGTPVTWAKPMGWLNDQQVVLDVRGATWTDAMVVLLDVTTNQAVQLSTGTFVAFVYP